jgi:transposase
LVKLVAKELGIELELDSKGNLKHIKAMASRRTFLADPTHRIRFVYTPKYTSWLNQIELWFSILVRRLLRRGSFTSVEDLSQRILAFIEYFNRTMAKPFKWTYKGRPLKV